MNIIFSPDSFCTPKMVQIVKTCNLKEMTVLHSYHAELEELGHSK